MKFEHDLKKYVDMSVIHTYLESTGFHELSEGDKDIEQYKMCTFKNIVELLGHNFSVVCHPLG